MAADWKTDAKRRRWANLVVILTSVYVILLAVWAPPGLGPAEAAADVANFGLWWWVHAIAGATGIGSVFLANRSRVGGRIAVIAAGVILLIGLFAFDRINWMAVRTLIIPAILLLGAAPFLGAMPSPEQEGKRRRGLGAGRARPRETRTPGTAAGRTEAPEAMGAAPRERPARQGPGAGPGERDRPHDESLADTGAYGGEPGRDRPAGGRGVGSREDSRPDARGDDRSGSVRP